MSQTYTTQPSRPTVSRRRQVYIRGSFQKRFVLQFCAVVLFGCLLFGVILYAYSTRTLTTAFIHSRLHIMSTADFLLPALSFTTLIVVVLVAIAVAIRVLLFSHKIAGPLYRLEKTAQAIGQGDLSFRIRLREGDELQNFAQSMDGALVNLRRHVQVMQEQAKRLRQIIQQLKQYPTAPQKLIQELENTQSQLDEAITRFRV